MTYFLARDGETMGELSPSDFRKQVLSGEIRPNDHYWTEGMEAWKPVEEWRRTAPTVKLAAMPEASQLAMPETKAIAVPEPNSRKKLLLIVCLVLLVLAIAAGIYFSRS